MPSSFDQEQRQPLAAEFSTTPAISSPLASPPLEVPVELPSTRYRPGYTRVPSISLNDERTTTSTMRSVEETQNAPATSSASSRGLGIEMISNPSPKAYIIGAPSTAQTPLVAKSTPEHETPGSADPLISVPSTGRLSGSTRYDGSPDVFDTSYNPKHMAKTSVSSLHSTTQPSLYARSDTGMLLGAKPDGLEHHHHCHSRKHVKQKRGNSISTMILFLAAFSTILSAIFLIIALVGPRWGRIIHTGGSLTASSAAFLTSFLAKLVELSFVTIVIAFLGQALARRAFKLEGRRGVTLAEMTMRSWVSQPGTMLTQWSSVRYAGITMLGVVSLVAAVVAMLYTSAATALVQPQLKYPDWEPTVLQGLVKTEFANPAYIADNCPTPITTTFDPEYAGVTCIQLEHAAMSYHNYFGYLSVWSDAVHNGTGSTDLNQRPKGFALLTDNTTITAPWIEQTNVTQLFMDRGLIINNVSMAMPHPGVVQAAIDPLNKIMQPADLDNLGSYNIRASVPSPVVHSLCVNMNKTQLKPFVYELWDDAQTPVDVETWPMQLSYPDVYLNGTEFDDVFRWGEAYGTAMWPPVFPILPMDFNTIFNDTTGIPWGRDSVYVLGKGGESDSVGNPTNGQNYALCQLRVSQTPYCSTQYNASTSGGTLEAVCEDSTDKLQYIRSLKTASSGNYSVSPDWPNIASEWATSVSLNDGVFNGNSSNARLLTQLILNAPWGAPELNPALPSIAEALAVMSGCTLLQAATDAPFVEFWNYTLPIIEGQHQFFNALIRAQEYASGGTQSYQKAFILVLFIVFAMNFLILLYFLLHRDWYMDFSEPSNLFSLAVNSPPSKELAGTGGRGPQGAHYKVNWKLNRDGEHVFMESQEKVDGERRSFSEGLGLIMTPVKRASARFDFRRST